MIQAIMLIALGFLLSSLIGVLLAPSLWSRAFRLSKKRLEAEIPLTLTEIEAAQDHLRATYAVRVRRLETALAKAKQKAANQLVDNSRLHMQIVALKDRIGDLELKLAERQNAATVLEQTITKRFPELDREINAARAELDERSLELQDLTGKLTRREEELAAARDAATSFQAELERLHNVLERSASDRSGRRTKRASQWSLEDYRSEYDRLNLELSKLRQQVAQLQERDSQQVTLIKGELQRLAESMLASAQQKSELPAPERLESFAKRIEERRERPTPWLKNAKPPVPLAARLKLEKPAPESPPVAAQPIAEAASAPSPKAAEAAEPPRLSPPHAPSEASPPKNGYAEASARPKILRHAVSEPSGGDGVGIEPVEPLETPLALDTGLRPLAEAEKRNDHADAATRQGQDREVADGAPAANGVHRAPSESDGQEGPSLADVIDLDSLGPDSEDEKIGPQLPTLIERLRAVSEDAGAGEKALPAANSG